jgi:hypothetical protein
METTARRGTGTLLRVGFTPETLAFQLFYHEVHHRAQAMAMLRQLGIAAEGLDFNRYAFAWTELASISTAPENHLHLREVSADPPGKPAG